MTMNQNYRSIRLEVHGDDSADSVAGSVGLTFMGISTSIVIGSSATNTLCKDALESTGLYKRVGCTVSDSGKQFDVIIYDWPLYPKENNIHAHFGNPAISDFFCDVTASTQISGNGVRCSFSDVSATNIREYDYCSNRGACNFYSGMCSCHNSFSGPGCTNMTFTLTGDDDTGASPGLDVNVLGQQFDSSAIRLKTDRPKSPDFNMIEGVSRLGSASLPFKPMVCCLPTLL